MLVIEVVQNALDDIAVGAGGDRLEKTSTDFLASLRQVSLLQARGPFQDLRLLEEHANRVWRALQDLNQKPAMAAPNIDNLSETAERI